MKIAHKDTNDCREFSDNGRHHGDHHSAQFLTQVSKDVQLFNDGFDHVRELTENVLDGIEGLLQDVRTHGRHAVIEVGSGPHFRLDQACKGHLQRIATIFGPVVSDLVQVEQQSFLGEYPQSHQRG